MSVEMTVVKDWHWTGQMEYSSDYRMVAKLGL